MKILLFTSVYPSRNAAKGATPVVHYFAREWAAMGHHVHVFHIEPSFPALFYLAGKLFGKRLQTRLGYDVPTRVPEEYDERRDGVEVTHLLLKKTKPHGRFPKGQIQRALARIDACIVKDGIPDCFVGHWDNPQLELLHALKIRYNRPTCLVYHNNRFLHFRQLYGSGTDSLVNDVDLAGFRNVAARAAYEREFGKVSRSFIAASGVSGNFIAEGMKYEREISDVRRFVYVGSLIGRKYPSAVITALSRAYQGDQFEVTYIGEGDEKKRIQQSFESSGCKGRLYFAGRIPRNEVIGYLKQSDVFVMISKGEIFGLVYLEAMALGCITIASRNEGIDGIIENGVNGFLCEAGNAEELAYIISEIRKMTPEALKDMSERARQTAIEYSDSRVAARYLEELERIQH